jgi:hypothetical protein
MTHHAKHYASIKGTVLRVDLAETGISQWVAFSNFPKCDFLSAPSLFLKRRRRMRGMKVGVVGDDG